MFAEEESDDLFENSGIEAEVKKFSNAELLPNPGEILQTLDGIDGIDWKSAAQSAIKRNNKMPKGDLQRDVYLGVCVTEAFLALKAEDKDLLQKRVSDIIGLRRHLNLGSSMLPLVNELQKSLRADDWANMYTVVDDIYVTVQKILKSNGNEDAYRISSAAAWFRGAELVSAQLEEVYDEEAAIVLNQPQVSAVIEKMLGRVEKYPASEIEKFADGLKRYQAILGTGDELSLSETQIKEIQVIAEKTLSEFQ